MAARAEATIRAVGLKRSFGEVEAVRGVDLHVPSGQIYGFLGPNGAGKSTTVKMLSTLLTPSGGSATVAGFDLAREADQIRLRIGVALQSSSLDLKQTGREILDLQGRFYGMNRTDRNRRVQELSELIDIGDALDRRIGTYSGGMARRLDLATALVHQPTIVFLDEPTTGLDPASRASIWDEVRRLNVDFGVTVFLTTQYLEEADVLADQVAIIDDGRIVAQGTPDDLKRSIGSDVIIASVVGSAADAAVVAGGVGGCGPVDVHGQELTIVTTDGSASIGPVAIALSAAGLTVTSMTLRRPTLDDVFLELTGARL
jgi:ABC-2 type transport system ATP-binding protein